MLTLDYSRQTGAADLAVMQASHLVIVGIGSASELVLKFIRMGIGKVTFIDPDIIEARNITSQGYTHADAMARTPKVVALERDCKAINPDAQVVGIRADFVKLPDAQLKKILSDATLLLMTTDHHPAQARGALAGLVCDVPVILGSIYRRGRAGEIVYTYPGLTSACYRCITKDRYDHVAKQRTNGTGIATGSLPFTASFVDAIAGHLAVGMLHKRQGVDNPYARWLDLLGQRNFIQTRMDPGYKLGDEDIFGDVFGHGEKVFGFDTIWQPGAPDLKCADCHGSGAIPVGQRLMQSTEIEGLPCGCLVQRSLHNGLVNCPACGCPLGVW